MKTDFAHGALVLILAAAVGLAACDLSLTEAKQRPFDQPLTTTELIEQLRSPNFRAQLEGRRELSRLTPEERLQVLTALLASPEVPSRLLAVQELAKLDHPEAKARLAQTAKQDSDETVRQQAEAALNPAPPEAPPAGTE